jgi:hypothetical protein
MGLLARWKRLQHLLMQGFVILRGKWLSKNVQIL